MEGLLRSVSSAISERFFSFFSLASAVMPQDDVECEAGDCDVSLDSESEADLEEELQTRLESMYGEATATACRQAREVLVRNFSGNLGQFLTEFLTPSLLLLERIRQQIYDASFATTITTLPLDTCSADNFWPLAYNDAVLVHLCDVRLVKHLRQEGDFFFCLLLRALADRAETAPSLALKVRTAEGVKELLISDGDFREAFSVMDWVNQARGAPDHELSYILRQCLIATEYTVNHLQWEETLQQRLDVVHSTNCESGCRGQCGRSHAAAVAYSQGRAGVPSQGCSQDSESAHCPSRESLSQTPKPGEHSQTHSEGWSQNSLNACSSDSSRRVSRHVPDIGGSDSESTLVSDDGDRRTGADGRGSDDDDSGAADGDGDRSCSSVIAVSATQQNGTASQADKNQARGHSVKETPEVSVTSYYTRRLLVAPASVSHLDHQLLHSGIAILPGCSDLAGKRLIFIFTCSVLWHHRQVVSAELAKLLMYYYSIPRRELVAQGMTIVVDVRGATSSTVNILLESLYLFKDNMASSMWVIHILADKPTQSLVLKSPVYDPQSGVRMELVLSHDQLLRSVSLEQLPPALDGTYPYNHEEWVRFRMKLEPFLTNCCAVAQFLVGVMQEVSSSDYLPRSATKTRELMQRHEEQVNSAFSDPRLLAIQHDGEVIMSSLRRHESFCCHSEDYRHALEKVSSLYRQLQETMTRLTRVAEARLQRLQLCLQLRGFEEECHKVMSWLQQEGQSLLDRHSQTADNLKAVKAQHRDFEKVYFSAMTHIEKGNDLMEEASMLSQTAALSENTLGYKEGARFLKKQLQLFTSQLEETRERIESTSRCYSLLDKSYEWALEAMKYVASMRMEHCATASGLDKLLHSLQQYLRQHPPVNDDTFVHMIDMAQRLHNEKLLEQCRVAKARCQETYHLLLLRQNTLQRARDQLVAELDVDTLVDILKETDQTSGSGGRNAAEATLPDSADTRVTLSSETSPITTSPSTEVKSVGEEDNFPVWEPRTTSTPTQEELCSGGFSPIHSRPISCRELKECRVKSTSQLAPEKSPVVVSNSLVKKCTSPSSSPVSPCMCLSSGPLMLNSPLQESSEFKTPVCKGTTHLQLSRTISHPSPTVITKASQYTSPATKTGPMKKMLKRTSSAPVPMMTSPVIYEDPEVSVEMAGEKQDQLSLITGSSESLPSMPEEEELQGSSLNDSHCSSNDSKIKWTPVSVNSHLHHSGTSPAEPMSGLRLSGNRRTVLLIMSEMVQTERDYTRSLQYIIENYIPELERVDVPQMLRGKRNVIFSNVEKIYQFHSQYFLRELEACQHNPFLVGHYFLRHEPDFHLYTLYNKNKPKSDDLMLELGKQFFRQKQLELGDRMDLASYLLKPVQRMGKYALLLKQILKECPETQPEYADLKAAEEMVRFQLRHGNDLLAMDSLRDVDVNLQEQGKLLRQDEFLVFQGRRKMMRRVFLFEDLILFSKTRRGRQGQHDIYMYKLSLKMADIGLTESFDDSGYKFEIWFRRRSLGDNYVMQAPSTEVKSAWVREISRILWHQAIRNRESHINEMASMGIGNKPCMDIKPSCDNIQQRSLDMPLSSRGARTRNSIAVSSMEYLRNSNKRPHSIISVSSNSSSSSSHSSLGLFGSLNLAFDHVDSPKHLNRQSMLSNESGIEIDHSSGDGDTAGGKPGQQEQTFTSLERTYSGVLQPRVLNQSFTEPIMTDV